MATWRRRDLERRSSERSRRTAQALRPELLLAVLALVVAAVSLWQAMSAQSRAELLAHDLATAQARLRNLDVAAPAAPVPAAADAGIPPLPAPPPGGSPSAR
jgi:hypothetical protein